MRQRIIKHIGFLVIIGVAFAAGWWLNGNAETPMVSMEIAHSDVDQLTGEWTCSMHPDVRMPEPGQCPICFMDLIPASGETGEEANDHVPQTVALSAAARELARISTTQVRMQEAFKEIELVGKFNYAETARRHISSWIGGRIESLAPSGEKGSGPVTRSRCGFRPVPRRSCCCTRCLAQEGSWFLWTRGGRNPKCVEVSRCSGE